MDFNISTSLTLYTEEIKLLHEIMKKLRPTGDHYTSTKIGFTLNVQLEEQEIEFIDGFLKNFQEEI